LQILFPVYTTNASFFLVVHRRGAVTGRLSFRIAGLLPLIGREHAKSLPLYR
jgi:hypothetical protein